MYCQKMSDDRIYQTEDGSEPFRFNRNVASVFPDMLHRSWLCRLDRSYWFAGGPLCPRR